MIRYRVEAWTVDDEDGTKEGVTQVVTFVTREQAARWAFERMEEGFQTRLYLEDHR